MSVLSKLNSRSIATFLNVEIEILQRRAKIYDSANMLRRSSMVLYRGVLRRKYDQQLRAR